MNPLTREWIDKAEGDYHAAGLLLRARKHPNYDASCFHAQQCAEKYMKAVLCEAGKRVDRTHKLDELLDQLILVHPIWDALRESATRLTVYAVHFRYPHSSADKVMAKEALRACEFIRLPLREHLGLTSQPRTERKKAASKTKRKCKKPTQRRAAKVRKRRRTGENK